VVEEGTQPRFSSSFGEKLADRTTTHFFVFVVVLPVQVSFKTIDQRRWVDATI
jgi:hypothetical protein